LVEGKEMEVKHVLQLIVQKLVFEVAQQDWWIALKV
jgi:hypothetical protein